MMGLFRKKNKTKKKKSPLLIRLGLAPAVLLGNLITKGLEVVTKKTYGRQTTKELASTPTGKVLGAGTVIAATALGIAASPVVAAGGLKGFAASLIPTSAIGKAATLLGIGVATVSPTFAKAIYEAPRVLVETGEEIGLAIEELPEEEKVGVSPLGLVAAAVIGAAAVSIPAIIKGKEEEIPTLPLPLEKEKDVGVFETPITPELVEIPPKRRKKRAIQPRQQIIKQSVRVLVSPIQKQSITQRYLKVAQFN